MYSMLDLTALSARRDEQTLGEARVSYSGSLTAEIVA